MMHGCFDVSTFMVKLEEVGSASIFNLGLAFNIFVLLCVCVFVFLFTLGYPDVARIRRHKTATIKRSLTEIN